MDKSAGGNPANARFAQMLRPGLATGKAQKVNVMVNGHIDDEMTKFFDEKADKATRAYFGCSKEAAFHLGYKHAAEKIKGGEADNKSDDQYDSEQLVEGMEVELEHTEDLDTAKEIAKDHLEEGEDYYERLEEMEEEMEEEKTAARLHGYFTGYTQKHAEGGQEFFDKLMALSRREGQLGGYMKGRPIGEAEGRAAAHTLSGNDALKLMGIGALGGGVLGTVGSSIRGIEDPREFRKQQIRDALVGMLAGGVAGGIGGAFLSRNRGQEAGGQARELMQGLPEEYLTVGKIANQEEYKIGDTMTSAGNLGSAAGAILGGTTGVVAGGAGGGIIGAVIGLAIAKKRKKGLLEPTLAGAGIGAGVGAVGGGLAGGYGGSQVGRAIGTIGGLPLEVLMGAGQAASGINSMVDDFKRTQGN
jgi:hypothetical protein